MGRGGIQYGRRRDGRDGKEEQREQRTRRKQLLENERRRRDKTTRPDPAMAVRPYDGGHFEKIGSEESHTIESYERKIHGTPFSEPQRQASQSQYTERRTYGRDENGDIVVKIEKNPSEPVRPVSPVQPVSPVGRDENLLRPIQPLTIPRIELSSLSRNNSPRHSPRHRGYADDVSPRSVTYQLDDRSPRSGNASPRSNASGGSNGEKMKKIIKKSRWVSIHDGRPVSPFTETVFYEPMFPDRYSSASHQSGRSLSVSPRPRPARHPSDCAILMENPLFRD